VDSTAFHLLGTSGTVTSLAGMHLGLPRYDRSKVDGLWMKRGELIGLMERVQAMSLAERAKQPCVGPERSGLLVTGCALVHGIMDAFPSDAMRIADRGLREGLLMGLAERRRRAARRKKTVHA
jgi:exopolyphosphatase/guanosine-5'-triphosphate,3'-diphosphate pyrophosphatase